MARSLPCCRVARRSERRCRGARECGRGQERNRKPPNCTRDRIISSSTPAKTAPNLTDSPCQKPTSCRGRQPLPAKDRAVRGQVLERPWRSADERTVRARSRPVGTLMIGLLQRVTHAEVRSRGSGSSGAIRAGPAGAGWRALKGDDTGGGRPAARAPADISRLPGCRRAGMNASLQGYRRRAFARFAIHLGRGHSEGHTTGLQHGRGAR